MGGAGDGHVRARRRHGNGTSDHAPGPGAVVVLRWLEPCGLPGLALLLAARGSSQLLRRLSERGVTPPGCGVGVVPPTAALGGAERSGAEQRGAAGAARAERVLPGSPPKITVCVPCGTPKEGPSVTPLCGHKRHRCGSRWAGLREKKITSGAFS